MGKLLSTFISLLIFLPNSHGFGKPITISGIVEDKKSKMAVFYSKVYLFSENNEGDFILTDSIRLATTKTFSFTYQHDGRSKKGFLFSIAPEYISGFFPISISPEGKIMPEEIKLQMYLPDLMVTFPPGNGLGSRIEFDPKFKNNNEELTDSSLIIMKMMGSICKQLKHSFVNLNINHFGYFTDPLLKKRIFRILNDWNSFLGTFNR